MRQIKIKYLRDIEPMVKIVEGDWIDLRAGADMFIPKRCSSMIPLGVAMELPEGYEAIVAPRSSTFKKYGIIMTNGIGVIDETYCGDNDEWHFPAYCLVEHGKQDGEPGTFIKKNERICQFRIQKHQPRIKFKVVESLDNDDRGGFGSTGSL